MPTTRIHVNQAIIRKNKKTGKRAPVLTCKTYQSNDYASEVQINGPCRVVYRPDAPLACGATVYVVTEAEVVIVH